jgi:hypothetical protein
MGSSLNTRAPPMLTLTVRLSFAMRPGERHSIGTFKRG